ncbi:DUF2243 domain-containing protein [Streptomyces sudanensis]|uniref:DUF2243 domain-containing protein n=1 Tax=Streptomyces sudanensis TaxID=436397 RepID=UPI0020CE836B|nr:DUF2243 domain-containing protein [Streptomyces sudanensis]MCP9956349.1 DUF2243 domain-containing protein [Streptomyces sudanensis]MCQ0003034.1 DUF2243 domain-containing protein [Streptomyces sudanensis]
MANGAAPPRTTIRPRRSLAVFALIGAALMAALDEIVFHQILHWHHFYDRSTPGVGLLSDGLLHTAEICALAAGAVLYADLRRLRALSPPHARAGLLLGLGGFQVFDGVVNHKLLRLHQIRYGVDVTPYDWAWNAAGILLLLLGAALALRARRTADTQDTDGPGAGARRADG